MDIEMRPVERGAWPLDSKGVQKVFRDYDHAQPDLYERLGAYCSYCEMPVLDCIHVEHILPKNISSHQALKKDWSNFLLACGRCNSIKGQDDIMTADYFWPHSDNTFRAFQYEPDGLVRVNPGLNADDQKKAQKTLALTGIDRRPGHPSFNVKDRRWQERRDVWSKAEIAMNALHTNSTPELINTIVSLAKATGFWSIWMTVFQSEKAMLARFISEYPGTCTACFDVDFAPLPRPNGTL